MMSGFALAALLVCVPAQALDPRDPLGGYGRSSWGEDSGLLSGPVQALAQDKEGYLWVGTDAGLLRFDGAEFTSLPVIENSPLAHLQVRCLLAARDGSVWAGGNAGLIRISGGTVVTYLTRDGLPSRTVATLAEDSDGTVWAGGNGGAMWFAHGRWEAVSATLGIPHESVYMLSPDIHGGFWVSTPVGVFHRPAGATRFNRVTDYSVRTLDVDRDGFVWGADGKHGVHRLDHGGPDGRHAFIGELGIALLRDRDGNLWVGSPASGLWRVRTDGGRMSAPEQFTYMGASRGNDRVSSLLEDRDGNLWVGLGTRLVRLSDTDVTMLGPAEGLPDAGISAVAVTRDQRVWAASSQGLYSLPANSGRPMRTRREMTGSINALHVDDRDRLWLATVYRDVGQFEVGRFDSGHFTPLALPSGTLRSPVAALAVDRDGGVWICSVAEGLQRWFRNRVEHYPTIARLNSVGCSSADRDADGRIWFGLSGGAVAVYSGGLVRLVDASSTLSRTTAGAPATVHVGPTGTVWLSSADAVLKLDGDSWSPVASEHDLPAGLTATLIEDTHGHLWASIKSGLLYVGPPANRRASADFRVFDESTGLTGLVGIRPGSPAAARTEDGRLWFGTTRGLSIIDPAHLRARGATSATRIDQVIADGRALANAGVVKVPAGTTKLEVHYGALNLSVPQSMRFRYRLDGVDADWVDAGTRRQAFYTNLLPRAYRFRVIVSDKEGGWNGMVSTLALDVAPTFTQTRSFYVLVAGCGLVILAGASWLRVRGVKARFASILAERARVARELHDTLLQSLGSVAVELEAVTNNLAEEGNPALETLVDLRSRVTEAVLEARESIERLRAAPSRPSDVRTVISDLARSLQAREVSCVVRMAGDYRRGAAIVEEQLVRITQESVSNALRHGRAKRIEIELEYQLDSVLLCVGDNGCGFDPSETTIASPGHWGVATMRERAALVGGSFHLTSQRGHGTQIAVVLPLQAEVRV
jgi:ligand-binding sensor domain-containing protein/signal transduction histidine kinase